MKKMFEEEEAYFSICLHLSYLKQFKNFFFPLIGRIENVNRCGFRRNRISELEMTIEIDLLVMNVKIHSIAILKSVRIL